MRGVWDVELNTVLGITKRGHRKRILKSIILLNGDLEEKTDLVQSIQQSPLKASVQHPQQQPQQQKAHRNSGYRKNR